MAKSKIKTIDNDLGTALCDPSDTTQCKSTSKRINYLLELEISLTENRTPHEHETERRRGRFILTDPDYKYDQDVAIENYRCDMKDATITVTANVDGKEAKRSLLIEHLPLSPDITQSWYYSHIIRHINKHLSMAMIDTIFALYDESLTFGTDSTGFKLIMANRRSEAEKSIRKRLNRPHGRRPKSIVSDNAVQSKAEFEKKILTYMRELKRDGERISKAAVWRKYRRIGNSKHATQALTNKLKTYNLNWAELMSEVQ